MKSILILRGRMGNESSRLGVLSPRGSLRLDLPENNAQSDGMISPRSNSTSLTHTASSAMRRITSPRRSRTTVPDRYVDGVEGLIEIDGEELDVMENIGWGATGKFLCFFTFSLYQRPSGVIKRAKWKGQTVAAKFLFPQLRVSQFKAELVHWR